MTKHELEIRLQIAEQVINECLYMTTNEYADEVVKRLNRQYRYEVNSYILGELHHKLGFFIDRADEAVNLNGNDIYKREIKSEQSILE